MSDELRTALEQVTAYLERRPGKAQLDGAKLRLECGTKYVRVWWFWTVLVLLPDGRAFAPKSNGGGRLPNFNRPVGNVIELVKRKNWQKLIRFELTEYKQPEFIVLDPSLQPNACGACGRTKHVQRTVVGPRCSHCRGADVRHMNAVRSLGHVPTANGRSLRTNADYHRS